MRSRNEGREVLLVHRPRYDDWTLPKGKAEPGESDEECALREVEEETGLVCRLGRELHRSEYVDQKGRPKVVRYWLMEAERGEARARHEVDELAWLPLAEAARAVSYERDVRILRGLVEVLLVRHASAGSRKHWQGDDRLRPLDDRGDAQARALVDALEGFRIERIFSSPYVRCLETVVPLAGARRLDVEPRPQLEEGRGRADVAELLDSAAGAPALLCTHGDVVEAILGSEGPKSGAWALERSSTSFSVVEEIPPAA